MAVNDATSDLLTLYVDGAQVAQVTQTSPNGAITGSAYIGRGGSTGTNYLNGSIDEVAFFNKAISSVDVTWLRNNSVAAIPEPATPGLLALGGLGMARRRR